MAIRSVAPVLGLAVAGLAVVGSTLLSAAPAHHARLLADSGGLTHGVLSTYPASGNEGPSNGHNENGTSGTGHNENGTSGVGHNEHNESSAG